MTQEEQSKTAATESTDRKTGGRRSGAGGASSRPILPVAGVLLVALAGQSFLGSWSDGSSTAGLLFVPVASAESAPATMMSSEVQSNGDVIDTSATSTSGDGSAGRGGGGGGGGGGEGGETVDGVNSSVIDGSGGEGRKVRVSSDVRVRFPVTVVEEQPARMVVIGDVHGDLDAFAEIVRAAGLVDDAGNWAAGETVFVQAGDIFDRGDFDLEVEEWLWTLQEQAEASGGAVYHLLGNHEIMNAMGDHSTASAESFKPFLDLDVDLRPFGNQLDEYPAWVKSRLAAMSPTGPVAKMLASHSVAMKVGDTLFVHGGLRPVNLDPKNCWGSTGMACLENINRWTHEWLLGEGEMPQAELWNRESPVWSRYYSLPGGHELGAEEEAELQQVLDMTGTVRMVVGHTPQEAGINSALGGRLWRTDTGMTAMIGGQPEALEIANGVATILTTKGRVSGESRACKAGRTLPHLPVVSEHERKSRVGRSLKEDSPSTASSSTAYSGDTLVAGAA